MDKCKECSKLRKLAKAYQDMTVSYRLGQPPSEKVFETIEKYRHLIK